MITEIGIVAGEIWQILDELGPCHLDAVSDRLRDRSLGSIFMSLGWLCREGHVRLEQLEDGYRISLK